MLCINLYEVSEWLKEQNIIQDYIEIISNDPRKDFLDSLDHVYPGTDKYNFKDEILEHDFITNKSCKDFELELKDVFIRMEFSKDVKRYTINFKKDNDVDFNVLNIKLKPLKVYSFSCAGGWRYSQIMYVCELNDGVKEFLEKIENVSNYISDDKI